LALPEGLEIRVPDIGDFEDVEVVEILVAKGDRVEFDDPLVSIESDKATMEIPAPAEGIVAELRVSEGDRVSEGSILLVLEDVESSSASEEEPTPASPGEAATAESGSSIGAAAKAADTSFSQPEPERAASATQDEPEETRSVAPKRVLSIEAAHPIPDRSGLPHASPLVRRYARELGVPIEGAQGTGPEGRILVDDLTRTVRERFKADAHSEARERAIASGKGIPPMPSVDHAAFGPVREEKLTRIQKVSGPALHRSWLNVPHVTQYDEADVTELERFRRDRQPAASERGIRLSPLLFVMKAVVVALRAHPKFRSSLTPDGDRLIIKDYFHLGIAVDTEQGLVVPVIRDVDRKGIFELAEELAETAERARLRKLVPEDLSGACFTISSLGGIGGTAFSPIVNAPEVAILGLSRTRVQPSWRGPSPLDRTGTDTSSGGEETGHFEPRLVLPLSLSYDHRVIDGAEAVRFTTRLASVLSDPMQLLL
jgi:pyruvate dehydrogenase E2 component (dihydrolipoamide acetyltransferase)